MALPNMLTTDEVAAQLRTTRLNVATMLREGRLPGIRNGRRWLIPEDALSAWIARGGQPLPGGWRNEA